MTELPINHPLAAAYIDLNDMTVMLNSGRVIEITELLDEDGDVCDPDDAVVAIAGVDNCWLRVPVPAFDKRTLN